MAAFLPKDLVQRLQKQKFATTLLAWYKANNRQLPWRLDYRRLASPYPVLVSEIMLQQTVIEAVLPAYDRFMQRFPELIDLAEATPDEVRQTCRGLGYYRRFGFLHATAKAITEAKSWPTDFASWRALPGIGEYTASALSSIVNQVPVMVVDGNVERVFCRLLDLQIPANTPALKRELQKIGPSLVDPKHPGDFNQALMELGQLICRPVSPACEQCPVSQACLAKARSSQKLAPQPKLKVAFKSVNLRILLEGNANGFNLEGRPPSAKFLAGISGFKTLIQQKNGQWLVDGGSDTFKIGDRDWQSVGHFRHAITNHKLSVQVFVHRHLYKSINKKLAFDATELNRQLVASLDQKALNLLMKEVVIV
ncbi:MAG: A/G-specific adenine glycosylase [Oligoflexales bacterium]|nr:A/G-specific adenine glycosylase [Oligoflexales bacterium]